ncbi:MAG: amidohydrolase [Bacteroidales bacterium]|nr:amidohydrolase [Bacteroidales bacterium]
MIKLKDILLNDAQVDIYIDGKRICKIVPTGTAVAGTECAEVMDCSGKAAIPGFVNMHTHSPMSMMRGIGEDMVFNDWISRIWDIEAKIDHDFIYWGSKVSAIEMIRTGTTTFNDQYWSFPSTVQAAREMGLRVATGYDLMDKGDAEEARKQMEQCEERYELYKQTSDYHTYTLSFHAIYSVSEPMMVWAAEFAREKGILLHIHLCETMKEVEDCKAQHGGLTPVEYLDRLGVLGPNIIAAHTLWLTEHDIELLAKHHVTCVHNINSNTKLCSGYRFLYDEMRDAGINLCIGTDGCASSNNLDMLEAMKTSALFQKAWRNDPKALPLSELFAMATANGAKTLSLDAGKIEEGKIADISIVDMQNTYFLSPAPFLANLIYSAHSDCIDSVMINGRWVMKHRVIDGEQEILEQARKHLKQII